MINFNELEQGERPCQHFIILSPPRTGTHMLRSALLEDPCVVVHHELFNPYSGEFHPYSLKESVESILKNYAFRPFHPEIKAVGFPINEHQANKENAPQWIKVWEELRKIPHLKIIRLRRENLLRAFISRERAMKTHQWTLYPNNRSHYQMNVGVNVDPKILEMIFTRNTARYQNFNKWFKNQPKVEIIYERMCDTPIHEFNRVQEFLGLELRELKPTTQKQANFPLSKTLLNYELLKEHFSSSPWAAFFEE